MIPGRASVRGVVPLLAICLFLLGSPLMGKMIRVELGDGMRAILTDGQDLMLEALPLRHEGLIAFAGRLCGPKCSASTVARHNRNVSRLLAGFRYKLPFEYLRPQYQRRVLIAVFAEDSVSESGWQHVVQRAEGRQSESLWQIAEWFTGGGSNYRKIRDSNKLADEEIRPGQTILIPRELLLPGLAPVAPIPRPEPHPDLEYGEDSEGRYALYRLRGGEALYSSVVVRFTGRIFADDVNRLAGEIAARSAISDVTSIPVGFKVKIPLDLLQPEFLPVADPRRLEYESDRTRSAGFMNQVHSLDLAGVTVVLDAGHGGRDVGASIGSVWESTYVYDIMLRARRILMSTTAAKVMTTTRDGPDFTVVSRDVLGKSRGHAVLTSPPYSIDDARVASNLRWYLANSILSGTSASNREKVVFVSIHADSLHPSLRGAMIYLPGLLASPASYGKSGRVYSSRREVRERPRVSFSRQERVRSEGLSRDMAQHLIRAFADHGLNVHDNKPVRDRVVRQRSEFVPAVLRFNAVPAKVLVEVCNLGNPQDRALIQTQDFRERVARAIVDGISSYYGSQPSRSAGRVAGR